MFPLDFRPELRWPLDVKPAEQNGQKSYLLSDLLGIAPETAIIPAPLMPIVSRFDGTRTIAEIAEEGKSVGLTAEFVSQLAAELDRMLFLCTPQAQKQELELRKSYREGVVREAALAGIVYPLNPDELREAIDSSIQTSSVKPVREQPVAVICPHIDYYRGHKTYGALFSAIKEIERPDIIFLIGTAHQPGRGIFHLTDRSFDTPFGVVPVAAEIVAEIARSFGEERAFYDEILHRREHSLELQLPYLARQFYDVGFPAIVPILVGSFHQFVTRGRSPAGEGEVADFIGAISDSFRALKLAGKRILFYGGVDLAHVGQHFGDISRFDPKAMEQIERRDRELLDSIFTGDAERLFEHIAEDGDARRICGFPSMYVMLRSLKLAGFTLRGELIEYRQALDYSTDCHVTFASAAWYSSL